MITKINMIKGNFYVNVLTCTHRYNQGNIYRENIASDREIYFH